MEYRLGPRIIEPLFSGSGTLVRLTEDVRKCVVYLGFTDPSEPSGFKTVGTGFLVADRRFGCYLITAAHVSEALTSVPFGIRLNEEGTRVSRVHEIDKGEWFYHPSNPAVDIGVMPYVFPDWSDVSLIPWGMFATDFKVLTKDIGAGDLAYVVGIFNRVPGTFRNLPFVHTGHIALMAEDEEIEISNWRKKKTDDPKFVKANGYLVEAHTLPGTSGSPVFVRRSLATAALDMDEKGKLNPVKSWQYGTLWLLGIWHGAWTGGPNPDHPVPPDPTAKTVVPLGVGFVTPTARLMEIMQSASIRDVVEKNRQALMERTGGMPEPQ